MVGDGAVAASERGQRPTTAPEAAHCFEPPRAGEGKDGQGAVVDACAATRSAESIKPSEGPLEMLQARTRLLTLRAGRIGLPKKVPADQEGRQHEQQAAQKRIQRRHTADVWDGMDRKREKA
ncbi:unnamed protein product [Prorocentrum cordatum]|uniref:Ribosome biogenesis protein NOP53 n=1 Tax=Prorocentrum cordatum TaxID=2364126 RepID=A0ABN9S4U5_9DINO|nr:unnamed protein product [Polarella glacialis]